jgi:hypothetical protein
MCIAWRQTKTRYNSTLQTKTLLVSFPCMKNSPVAK